MEEDVGEGLPLQPDVPVEVVGRGVAVEQPAVLFAEGEHAVGPWGL